MKGGGGACRDIGKLGWRPLCKSCQAGAYHGFEYNLVLIRISEFWNFLALSGNFEISEAKRVLMGYGTSNAICHHIKGLCNIIFLMYHHLLYAHLLWEVLEGYLWYINHNKLIILELLVNFYNFKLWFINHVLPLKYRYFTSLVLIYGWIRFINHLFSIQKIMPKDKYLDSGLIISHN